jgi:hypothetical protein
LLKALRSSPSLGEKVVTRRPDSDASERVRALIKKTQLPFAVGAAKSERPAQSATGGGRRDGRLWPDAIVAVACLGVVI